jgi:hypothetical protein
MTKVEKDIRRGAILLFILSGIVLATTFVLIGQTGRIPGIVIIDVIFEVGCGLAILKLKSRIASTFAFVDQALGIFMYLNDPFVLLAKIGISYILFMAMIGTYKYHNIIKVTAITEESEKEET